MSKSSWTQYLWLLSIAAALLLWLQRPTVVPESRAKRTSHLKKVNPDKVAWRKKSKAYWKRVLTPKQYAVCRAGGTERAFTGALLQNKKPGQFLCSSCGHVLFEAKTKFRSGTGWPSFYDVASSKAVTKHVDRTYGMIRTEVRCGRCDAHLGHVFRDGPKPTGLRYCINSVCLIHRENKASKTKKSRKLAARSPTKRPAPARR